MNKDLKNDFYKFPVELLSHLMKNLNGSNKSENGFKRLKGICDQKGMGYKQAKKIKHEMENDMEPTVYKLIGGDELLSFINNSLDKRRDIVDGIKRVKMNSGLPNQFKKTHTKDKSKNSTKVNLPKVATNSDAIMNNRAIYENIDRINNLIKKVI
tara:strand:+ start:283 stop:747 length:465 start_codon:yes stop_codon:yes gene_type:complete